MERQRISLRNGESEISESSMSGWPQMESKTEMEIEEEFCAMVESIKSEDESKADIKPAATFPEKYVVPRIEASSDASESTQQSNNDVSLSLRCRLCAMSYNDMVDIFSSLEITADILAKIEYSLPIMVKETDTLPKQICRFCLEELERCHRFRKTVAEANELLLALEKMASMKSEETEKKNAFSPLHNAQPGSTAYDNIDGPSERNSDIEMNDNESTIIPRDAQTAIRLRSCSVVLSILDACSKDNSVAENGEKSSSNTEDRSADSTPEVPDIEKEASENNEESTSDSGENTESPDDFARAHSRNQLFRCNICAKTFKWKGSLTRHSKIHTNQGFLRHKCDTCAKMFKSKCSLTHHSKIHTGTGLHSCQYCEKLFKQASDLKRHAVVHSEERNYRCPLCDKSFKRSDTYKSHMDFVHLNNRPWRCAHCNKTFGRKWQLRQHLGTCKLRSE